MSEMNKDPALEGTAPAAPETTPPESPAEQPVPETPAVLPAEEPTRAAEIPAAAEILSAEAEQNEPETEAAEPAAENVPAAPAPEAEAPAMPQPPVYPQAPVCPQAACPQPPVQPQPPYGYAQPPVYNPNIPPVPYTVIPQNGTQPPVGYPQPTPCPGGPTAYYAPRRKMALGLKILLIVMAVLFAGSLVGFIGYGMYTMFTNPSYEALLPTEDLPGGFDILPEEEKPNEAEPADPETEKHEIIIPDIEVTPNTDGIRLSRTPSGAEMEITDIYNKVMQSTVLVITTGQTGYGTGTGIIATEDGYIITNSHVVLNTRSVQVEVKTNDGKLHPAVVVGFDKTTDLAVLKIEGRGFTPAEFGNSDELQMGQWVLAIGNPGGEQFSGSITRGIVSGLERTVGSYSANGMTYIQTDTAINPGNSGGPLVNLHGQVVGINSAKIVSDEYEGMGFAIPISGAKAIIDDLLSGGYVQGRVRLGIRGYEIDEMTAAFSGVEPGFMISEFDGDSCFHGTKVQANDIITGIDDHKTASLDALGNALLHYAPGDTATVHIFRPSESGRGGESFDVTITLLEDKGETQN